MSTTGNNPPAWHPDPQGRHEHRYWDGAQWTDQVSDGGRVGTDPVDSPKAAEAAQPTAPMAGGGYAGPAGPAGVPGAPGAPMPGPAGVPGAPGAPMPGPPSKGGLSVGLLVGIGAAVAIVIIGGLFAFKALSGGDDGLGTSSGSVDSSGDVAVHEVELDQGDIVRVLVTPEGDFDPQVGIAATRDALTTFDFGSDSSDASWGSNPATDEFFSDTDEDLACEISSDDFSRDIREVDCEQGTLVLLGSSGERESGEQEFVASPALVSGTYAVMVRGEDGSTGDFELKVEKESTGQEFDNEFFSDGFSDFFVDNRDFFCPDDDFFGDASLSDFTDSSFQCEFFSD